MSAIKISNNKSVETIAKVVIKVMKEWKGESEATKVAILSVINEAGKAPTSVNNCIFKGVK